jgi:Sas10 C-terminal domain/Sas10/Utp3/C1D family
MARGKRRTSVTPSVVPLESAASHRPRPMPGSDDDAVDGFVESRHRDMLKLAGGDAGEDSDDGADFGVGGEVGVLDIDVADDDSDGDDDSDVSEGSGDGDPMDGGWGGRRRTWYGGDTHEYEIMEDGERETALRDEEHEARRLQAKALAAIDPKDFVDSDADGGDDDIDGTANPEAADEDAGDDDDAVDSAPELPALVQELHDCMRAMRHCDTMSATATKFTKLRYHVLCSYATNIAFYLSLRTDPDAARTDVRSHPVMREIVRLRGLYQTCIGLLKGGAGKAETVDPLVVPISSMQNNRGVANCAKAGGMASLDTTARDGDAGGPCAAKTKRTRRHKRKRTLDAEAVDEEGDEEFVRGLLGPAGAGMDNMEKIESEGDAKRRKLNRIVGALERDRQSRNVRRAVPADMDIARHEPAVSKQVRQFNGDDEDAANLDTQTGNDDDGEKDDDGGNVDDSDDEEFMLRMMAKKEKKETKSAAKKEGNAPHVYSFDDRIKDKDLRRRANSQVVNNRGLVRYRPKERKTPRTKNREAFHKAVKKRKSVVRDPVTSKPTSYGGEASGINMRARKGSRLADV